MSAALRTDWIAYWDNLPPGRLLLSPESEEYVRNLTVIFPITSQTRILDFGCGYGTIAERLARIGAKVDLWDAAPTMLRSAAQRLTGLPNIHEIHLTDSGSTERGPFDLILVNSVIQYMTATELHDWLRRWRPMLADGGRIVLSDLIPPDHSTLGDIVSLFRFGVRRGYLFRAMRGIWKERPRYHAAATQRPLLHVDRAALTADARNLGYSVRFLPRNLTHFSGRTTAVLEVASA
jgi:cyclopropane fatty-acyl-phospholipid synthase-like methyltransferase